jgi:hypothetical protein
LTTVAVMAWLTTVVVMASTFLLGIVGLVVTGCWKLNNELDGYFMATSKSLLWWRKWVAEINRLWSWK